MKDKPRIISTAHDWAINSDNSGKCLRCGLTVKGVTESKNAPRCVPHFESVDSGYKPEAQQQQVEGGMQV